MKKIKKIKPTHRSVKTKSCLASLIGIVVLAIFIMLTVTGCSSDGSKLNINEYIICSENGYDGYGSVDFAIDYEKMFDGITTDAKIKYSAVVYAKKNDAFKINHNGSNTLKNGDSVQLEVVANKEAVKALEALLDIKFHAEDQEHTISNLPPLKDFDPFEHLKVNTKNTVSGTGEIDFSIQCSISGLNIDWAVEHNGKNGELANGDTIQLTIKDAINNDELGRNGGLKITKTTTSYKIACLNNYAIDSLFVDSLNENGINEFNHVIDEWVLSGLCDESQAAFKREAEFVGYAFYVNLKDNNAPSDSMLCGVYKIQDPYAGYYYTYVGLNGIFAYDQNGIYMSSGEHLPTSFMYYDKIKIRYSSELGWEYGDESTGFLIDGVGYAGHYELKDAIEHMNSKYANKYDNVYMTSLLLDAIKN